MNQAICLVGVGNWTVHKVENLPSFSDSRSEERKGGGGKERGGGGGREKDIFIKTTEDLHALPWTCSEKDSSNSIHQSIVVKKKEERVNECWIP